MQHQLNQSPEKERNNGESEGNALHDPIDSLDINPYEDLGKCATL